MNARTFCSTALLTILLAARASAVPPGDPVAGQAAFNKSCAGCHGGLPQQAAYSPSVITNAISSVSVMSALGNALTATDFQNIAAYIGKTVNLQPNYQGLWWAAPAGVESGWGINVAHQYNTIFLTWFTYDATGKGWWLVMTGKPGVALAANAYHPSSFWQIHRGTVVNVNAIAGVSRHMAGHLQVRLKKRKETLAVSESYVHLFKGM